jgi:hypothetical protein
MNGSGEVPDSGVPQGGPTGFANANTTFVNSSSTISNSSTGLVVNGQSTFPPQTGSDGSDVVEPTAKRIKLDVPSLSTEITVNSVGASNAVPAAVPPVLPIGSGMSTEQFLQSLPQEYAAKTPAYMVMMQQQQQHQQQQRAAQQQQQLQQLQQLQQQKVAQHQQLQQHLQAQRQLQMQRQLMLQQQLPGTVLPTHPRILYETYRARPELVGTSVQHLQGAQVQAQAIVMAARAQNRMVNAAQQQQPQQPIAAAKGLAGQQPQKPQPEDDPACLICREKGGDLFLCSYSCGLTVHPKCIGEDKISVTAMGKAAVCELVRRS